MPSTNGDSRTVIIVQARMGSTRLPNKVLKEVHEKPLLGYLLDRLRRVKNADALVVATTNDPLDDEIVDFCNEEGISVERGEEENVLDRYYTTALSFSADVVVRICADCPLIDPEIVDRVISFYLEHEGEYDYVSNVVERTFPRGMDVEVFSIEALEKAWKEAHSTEEQEHVTLHMMRHPEHFRIANISDPEKNLSHYRLTLDTLEDFQLITLLLNELYQENPAFTLKDLLATLEKHPDWMQINAHISQKPLSST